MRTQFTLPDDLRGVVITGVEADSAAAEKSLRPGDVIVEVSQEDCSRSTAMATVVLSRYGSINPDANPKYISWVCDSGGAFGRRRFLSRLSFRDWCFRSPWQYAMTTR